MDEKYEEKELEKREEKYYEEKESEEKFDEKYRQDPLGRFVGAAILIWAGVVFLANNLGYLDQFSGIFDVLPSSGEWDWGGFPFGGDVIRLFLLGLIAIIFVEIIIRSTIPEYRRPILGSVIVIGVLLAVMYGNWSLIGPMVLIAVGISLLTRNWWGRK